MAWLCSARFVVTKWKLVYQLIVSAMTSGSGSGAYAPPPGMLFTNGNIVFWSMYSRCSSFRDLPGIRCATSCWATRYVVYTLKLVIFHWYFMRRHQLYIINIRRLQVCCSQIEVLYFNLYILGPPPGRKNSHSGSVMLPPPVQQHGMLFTHENLYFNQYYIDDYGLPGQVGSAKSPERPSQHQGVLSANLKNVFQLILYRSSDFCQSFCPWSITSSRYVVCKWNILFLLILHRWR